MSQFLKNKTLSSPNFLLMEGSKIFIKFVHYCARNLVNVV